MVLGIVALALVVLALLDLPSLRGLDDTARRGSIGARDAGVKRDYMFQVNGFEAEGQRLDMYFHYRYDRGIAERDIPDFRDLRSDAMGYMRSNASRGVYWETLSKGLCSELKDGYPIEAISCQLLVYPGDDPGFHSSVHTIGDIEPLAVPGPMRSAGSSGG